MNAVYVNERAYQSVIQLGAHVGFKTRTWSAANPRSRTSSRWGATAVICTEDEDLRERVADIAGHDGVSKAIDCVSGQVGADVSRALAPGGELVVYGALSTHRHTDPDKLTLPIFARSLIYETKTVRGFWLLRWFTETPKDRMAAAIDRTLQLAESGALRVPEGQPIPVESKHSDQLQHEHARNHVAGRRRRRSGDRVAGKAPDQHLPVTLYQPRATGGPGTLRGLGARRPSVACPRQSRQTASRMVSPRSGCTGNGVGVAKWLTPPLPTLVGHQRTA